MSEMSDESDQTPTEITPSSPLVPPSSSWPPCAKCGNTDPPIDGLCPVPNCRGLRIGNTKAAKPVNLVRRASIHKELITEFPPTNVLERAHRRQLAAAMERLETAKGGSPEWQRLSNEVRELSSDLHRPTPATTPKTTPLVDYDKFTTEQIRARLVRLLDLLPEDPAPDPAPVEINSTGAPTIDAQPISTYTRDAGPPVANATPEPAPEPEPCPWCHQPLTRCAEIKETRPEDWRALHYDHPDEKKRRADEATAVMYESWRRQRKGIGGPRW